MYYLCINVVLISYAYYAHAHMFIVLFIIDLYCECCCCYMCQHRRNANELRHVPFIQTVYSRRKAGTCVGVICATLLNIEYFTWASCVERRAAPIRLALLIRPLGRFTSCLQKASTVEKQRRLRVGSGVAIQSADAT